jgi:hypothetical protein
MYNFRMDGDSVAFSGDMMMRRALFFLFFLAALTAATRTSAEARGRPDHTYETGGAFYYSGGFPSPYPFFSASDRFGSGEVTLWNRLSYSQDHYSGGIVPGRLHNASETIDLRSPAFLLTGNASFRSDGGIRNISSVDYLLCPGMNATAMNAGGLRPFSFSQTGSAGKSAAISICPFPSWAPITATGT